MIREIEATNDVPLSSAEIAGYMNWRGPGAYTAHAERRIRRLVAEAVGREREACAKVLDMMADGAELDIETSATVAYYRQQAALIRARGRA